MSEVSLYVLAGPPYAGKTTLRKELVKRFGFEVVSIDEINSERGIGLEVRPIPQEDWNITYSEAYRRLKELLNAGKRVVFDGANLPLHERQTPKQIAQSLGLQSRLIYVQISEEEAGERRLRNLQTKERGHVDDETFKMALEMFEEPTPEENPLIFNSKMDINEWIEKNIA